MQAALSRSAHDQQAQEDGADGAGGVWDVVQGGIGQGAIAQGAHLARAAGGDRSEERRVGKEC